VNWRWALNRLSAMDSGEIGHRVQRQLRTSLERWGFMAAKVPPRHSTKTGYAWVTPLPSEFDVPKYQAAAQQILAGEFHIFALRPAQLGFPPHWNRDPKTGRIAPASFGKSLDYRDSRLVGDIKYLWEPSRHAELVTLAQAWHLTREERYSVACRTLLDSWFEQCPYRYGPHWTSSLEHAIRLINWSFAWQLLGADAAPLFQDSEGQAFKERWLTSIFQHCHFIAGHLSRHSSANNHLLGELTGLFIAALTWPFWRQSQSWAAAAQRELQEQALVQNGADGVNREQAVWYHHEVFDMLVLAGLVARANQRELSAPYWERLEAMAEFIASIMDVAGNVPSFGDADDAIIARLDPAEDTNVYRSLLATAAALFDSRTLSCKAARVDDKTRWLLGDRWADRSASAPAPLAIQSPARREFPEAGYYVLGHSFDTPREVRLVADAGPLGFLSIAAHGHADALSFTLSVAGQELLIDPGTFAYHTQPQWRDYFRGTSAHNTLRIDDVDQSTSGGNFLWTTHARTAVVEFRTTPQLDRLVAEHDGYRRLSDPLIHRRTWQLDHGTSALVIVDELFCKDTHTVEMFWHFAPECAVKQAGDLISAMRGNAQVDMLVPPQMTCQIVSGREKPPLGWISRRFDQRVAAPTVVGKMRIRGNVRLVTQIAVSVRSQEQPARAPTPIRIQERLNA
jgi:hypothetical protein